MSWYAPPARSPGRPLCATLPSDTVLWRVHSSQFGPLDFNPTDPDSLEAGGGGRFDSVGGRPAFLYAARTPATAIVESLLRDLPFDHFGHRELPRVALNDRCLSELRVAQGLPLVLLHGAGLSRIGQDTWLVRCGADEFARTRLWAAAIMAWSSRACGLEWRSRHDDDGLAVCLYEDRARGRLEFARSFDLWRGEGLAVARYAMLGFGVAPPLSGAP